MDKLVKIENVKRLILELRNQKVILDRDLAKLYQVSTRTLNQAVKRNIERFPADFMFQLTDEEFECLRSQIVIARRLSSKARYLPLAFTRNGANMLCATLKSPTAIYRSIQIMRAFSAIEEAISKKKENLVQTPKILNQLAAHSKAIMYLFQDSKLKTQNISKLHEIQQKIINLLQQIIIHSIKDQ